MDERRPRPAGDAAQLRHEHACLAYGSAAGRRRAAGAYLAYGLARGERCVYVATDAWPIEIIDALDEAGVDVARTAAMGALRILHARQTYLRGGAFSSDAMIALVRATLADALAAGYYGLRMADEMEWALEGGVDGEQLLAYERGLDASVLREGRLTGLCLYDRARFAGTVLEEIVAAHRVVLEDDER